MKTLVIAGTGSGVGKTSITLGLVRALKNKGLKVSAFKCGPDYLDPSWLKLASGNACYNLDSWMSDEKYVKKLFNELSQDSDVAIIEGVMGMFDGASATSLTGSTAEIASNLGAPVLLVCNSHGCARSFAATVKGFNEFEEDVNLAGVVANHCGSKGHVMIMEQALEAAKQVPLVGAIERNSLPELPGRHLGLHSAEQYADAEGIIETLAEKVEQGLDMDQLLALAPAHVPESPANKKGFSHREKNYRLGIAKDAAFQFYYPDNLEAFEKLGIDLVEFSPLRDTQIPEDCDGIYIGGGYPEVYASELSANESMLQSLKNFAKQDKFLYAECGGLMYLSQFVRNLTGEKFPMLGVLPFGTEMLAKKKMLGYTSTTLLDDCIVGAKGDQIRGHEFHYSQIIDEENSNDWQKVYEVCGRRKNSKPRYEGYKKGSILASYVHQHFASNPIALKGIFDSLSST